AELAFALTDSDSRLLLFDDAFAPVAMQLADDVPGLRTLVYCGDGATPSGAVDYETLITDSDPVPDARRGADALAGLFYTGGTTGTPKGVMLSHANMLTSALGSLATGRFLHPGSRYLQAAPMFHLADLAMW